MEARPVFFDGFQEGSGSNDNTKVDKREFPVFHQVERDPVVQHKLLHFRDGKAIDFGIL